MKEIKLSGRKGIYGKISLVDDDHFEWLSRWKWYVIKDKNTFYATRRACKDGRYYNLLMHRAIIRKSGFFWKMTDHKDRDGLNNQKENLRECNNSGNRMNSRIAKNNTSGFKGVCWLESRQRWFAQIVLNKKHHSIGYFKKKNDAAIAYNKAAREMFGEFAYVNKT